MRLTSVVGIVAPVGLGWAMWTGSRSTGSVALVEVTGVDPGGRIPSPSAMSRSRVPASGQRQGEPARAGRAGRHGVLALQQAIGNRAVAQTLARKPAAATTVQVGKLKIPVSGGNIAEWAAKQVPDTLDVSSSKGRHSAELERMSKERTKIPSLTLTVPVTG